MGCPRAIDGLETDLTSAETISDRPIERRALRDAVLNATAGHALTLVVAPPVSGKASLIDQIRQDLTSRGESFAGTLRDAADLPLVILQQSRAGQSCELDEGAFLEIEKRIAGGQRFLICADWPLQYGFPLLRLRGEVAEFGMRELALAVDEIPEFLSGTMGKSLPARTVRLLQARTGGWIGALNVVRGLYADGQPLAELARTFSGVDPDLVPYFEQAIMPMLEPEVAAFLVEIGPLERVCAKLADAVTGRNDGWGMLDKAAAQCPFLLADDRRHEWYRPHPLFCDYLRHVANRDNPEKLRRNLTRAAIWVEGEADWLSAARLYADAGELEKSIGIINQHTDDLITGKGDVLTFRQLISQIGQTSRRTPVLASDLALGSIFSGDFAGAAEFLDSMASHINSLPQAQRARMEAIRINIDFGFERFDRVIAVGPHWLEQNPGADPRIRFIVATALFWSYLAEQDNLGTYKAVGIARSDVSKVNAPFLKTWLGIISAVHKAEHGKIYEAETVLNETAGEGVIAHTVELVRAAMAWELGETERAAALIEQSLQEGTKHSVVETAYMGWATAARIALTDHGLDEALTLLTNAEAVMASRHGERARRLIRLLRIKLILQSQSRVEPRDIHAELEAMEQDSVSRGLSRSLTETTRMTLGRYHAQQGDPARAISIIQPIISTSLKQYRMFAWGEASLIYAGALARQNDHDKALRRAWQAIEPMAESGMMGTIIDGHILLLPMIEKLVAQAHASPKTSRATITVVEDLAQRAGIAISGKISARGNVPEGPMNVRLTDTELRVVNLAAQGRANADIAAEMMIKLSTVKWHMQNIFDKLQVRSRTAAIAELRRLGLIG